MDVEAEMNRFEQALEVEKRQYFEQPNVDPVREVTVALDALATCCLGAYLMFSACCIHVMSTHNKRLGVLDVTS